MTSGEQLIAIGVIVTALAAGYNDLDDVETKRARRCGRCSLKKKVAAGARFILSNSAPGGDIPEASLNP